MQMYNIKENTKMKHLELDMAENRHMECYGEDGLPHLSMETRNGDEPFQFSKIILVTEMVIITMDIGSMYIHR